MESLLTYATIAVLLIALLSQMFKILKEYERGVVFFLGRFQVVKGPGLIILIPGIQKMVRVDLRVLVLDVPTQDVISRDNVSVKVNAVIYFRVVDPEKAIIRVENFFEATSQLSQTTLRSVLGQHELDDMLAERDKLNDDIQNLLDQRTDNWGIKVANVEIKHVDLDESMIRAIAQQPTSEPTRSSSRCRSTSLIPWSGWRSQRRRATESTCPADTTGGIDTMISAPPRSEAPIESFPP
jgi:regulator of protease activity HflC (stomatin/prohibitin superfamily)